MFYLRKGRFPAKISLGTPYFNSNPHTLLASQILNILTYFYILYITLFILLHATVIAVLLHVTNGKK
jgi:hypothetical protein